MTNQEAIKRIEYLKNKAEIALNNNTSCEWLKKDVAGTINAFSMAIEALEKQATSEWIPYSERLPNKEEYLKNDGRFIVTDGNRVYQSIYDIYIQHCFRTLKFFDFDTGRDSTFEIDNCVIAWMPLPEAYEEKER